MKKKPEKKKIPIDVARDIALAQKAFADITPAQLKKLKAPRQEIERYYRFFAAGFAAGLMTQRHLDNEARARLFFEHLGLC